VRIQLGEGEDAEVRSWVLDAGPSGCRVTSEATRSPDAEAIVDAETWRLIASGRMSPLEAFARGRMRVPGDMQTARRLARQFYRRDAAES
jgi:putative sterol carrier protein